MSWNLTPLLCLLLLLNRLWLQITSLAQDSSTHIPNRLTGFNVVQCEEVGTYRPSLFMSVTEFIWTCVCQYNVNTYDNLCSFSDT